MKANTVKKYEKILRKDKDFDFAYLLILERFKLKRMIALFEKMETSFFAHERTWKDIRDMKLCVKLLDIILGEDPKYINYMNKYSSEDYGLKFTKNEDGEFIVISSKTQTFDCYVNINNASRFDFDLKDIDIESKHKDLMEDLKTEVRKVKSLYLYNKIRNKMMHWWI